MAFAFYRITYGNNLCQSLSVRRSAAHTGFWREFGCRCIFMSCGRNNFCCNVSANRTRSHLFSIFLTGHLPDHRRLAIGVAGRRNDFRFGFTTGAGTGPFPIGSAGYFLCHDPLAELVTVTAAP